MKSNFNSLIKKVFLSSVAGILANDSSKAASSFEYAPLEKNEKELTAQKINDLKPKLLLKQNKDSEWFAVAHRSHRSHSSHRSHYSSTSGSTSRSSSSTSRSSGSSTDSNSSNSTRSTNTPKVFYSNSSKLNSGISVTTLKLGDRNLKLGMSGSDVTQLINILITKGYLKLQNGELMVTGIYTYDETIEAVVKQYQKDNGLVSDGTCGAATTYYLLKK